MNTNVAALLSPNTMPPPPPSGSDLPTVSTTARGVVVRTNQAWCQLCGYTESEVVGRTLKCIQGPGTDQVALRQLMEAVQAGRPVRVTLVNYASDGSAFRHVVDVVPESCGHLFRATSFDVVRMNVLCRALSSVDAIDISMQDFPGQEIDTCPSMLTRWERGSSYSLSLPSLPLLPLSRPLPTPQPIVHHVPSPHGLAKIPISMDRPDSLVVVTSCASPYPVLWASDAWLRMCDFSADELTGRSLRCIQGVGTDRQQLARLSEAAEAGVAVDDVSLINYTKQGRPFRHVLSMQPVFANKHDTQAAVYMARSSGWASLTCGETHRVAARRETQVSPFDQPGLWGGDVDATVDDEDEIDGLAATIAWQCELESVGRMWEQGLLEMEGVERAGR